MITLSNGKVFTPTEARLFLVGLKETRKYLGEVEQVPALSAIREGRNHALSTAIAAIDAAIENAELAIKSAQRKEEKMKAAKKPAAKPVAKKPAIKPAAKKPTAKKK